MEPAMKMKANPSGIDGGSKALKMADYKVDSDNHLLFINNDEGRKFGSPVRIFTNLPLNLIKLSEQDGYKYCKRCDKWSSQENKHCKKCKSCTSKDGRRYRHCNTCNRCVKPTWKHCKKCERCLLKTHTCGVKPRITGECFKCKSTDHIEKDCPVGKPSKKRKNNDTIESLKFKKIKKNTNDVCGNL
ncbi:rRNA N6-adenosine-methyltransferase ZCCHC4-like [Aphidius gifuensis]|uniref:rRNA N6-adenosine-methyltransferase ZCCHC4-like n=1 Tax=Aphidius gifuensis TaxID=684658 RepID=UPI001CDC7890|nr:rRNA N6-adenosine-methyltransferase ZCCHC4-like [Aphidius gifuensis]XP_044015758.1 rRNA N6-adenosine-methyltransferase ZCCHC4-like [Aphidius gifuensis]